MSQGVSLDITCKISKTQIRKAIKQGGSLWSNLISLGARALPYATSALSKVVPALATGAMSVLGSFGINKIFGKGVQQGGFLTRPNKIKQLINYRHQKPPFLGTWGNPVGMGVKQDHKKQAVFYWEKTIRSTQFRF